MEAIILAGGLGTRLKSVVSDLPKPMAPVRGKPFLSYILDYLSYQGIKKVILATGYKHKAVEKYFKNSYESISISYSIETEPLGTGGGIKKALDVVNTEKVYIINGDTLFNVNLSRLLSMHESLQSDLTLSLKPMENYDRYGSVICQNSKVIQFQDKHFKEFGYINGGVYLVNTDAFKRFSLPEKFSFEKDFLERYIHRLSVNAYVSDTYFIDIGIPEDYAKAQSELNSNL